MPPRSRKASDHVCGPACPPGTHDAGGIARGYSWPPFEKGNVPGNSTHGAGDLTEGHIGVIDDSDRGRGMSLRAQERAEGFLEAALADPDFPDYLKLPFFRHEVEGWARVQTQADMVYEWFTALPEDERYVPGQRGAQKTPLELWLGVDAQAAKYRNRLGLNPVSYAKLRVALGLHKKAQDDAIAGLAKQGAKIRKRREARVLQLRAEDAEGA